MSKRNVLIAARLFFGLLALAAIGTQLVIHIRAGYSIANYFSSFTNVSNFFAAGVMIISARALIKHREPTAIVDIIQGNSAVCMALVGIIYSVFLRGLSLGHIFPWAIILTRYIMPVVVVLDWLYQPQQSKTAVKQVFYWLIVPLIFLGYSIFRGAIIGSYVYPFFNPDETGGYDGVVLYYMALIAMSFLAGWLLLTLRNMKQSLRSGKICETMNGSNP
jgi:hypothetical protein